MKGIYAIINPSKCLIYIGSSNNIRRRFYDHRRFSKQGKAINASIRAHIDAGEEHIYKVLIELPDNTTKEKIYFIESCVAAAIKPDFCYNRAYSIFRGSMSIYKNAYKEKLNYYIAPAITYKAAKIIADCVGRDFTDFLTITPTDELHLSQEVEELLESFSIAITQERERRAEAIRTACIKCEPPQPKQRDTTIQRKLKSLLVLKRKNMIELAAYLGISPQSMQNKFNRGSFSAEDLIKISEFTDCTLAFDIDGTQKIILDKADIRE